ncbi:peptidoglycan-binding protein [Intrasporangium sp. YIM S08009]|uniref:peptidoglycan-binding protein n=1 Tax=Intrasporangium zincisolvens TaxID=3080018 RepID=UPI002B054D1F|nr:peptidoglycan-binding protein [Intrasporangium sp. YIM S08009]
MTDSDLPPVSPEELAAEAGAALPDKEVMSLLDLNADLNLALDVAAPIDLAVGANANVAAPIAGAVGANILSVGSTDAAVAHQAVNIDQGLTGSAIAHAPQHSDIQQTTPDTTTPAPATTPDPGTTTGTDAGSTTGTTPSSALSGNLLNIDVNAAADAKLAAPVDGAVAANANVAAPIDASVSANVGSVGSQAVSMADQSGSITQHLDGTAQATADQTSTINQ